LFFFERGRNGIYWRETPLQERRDIDPDRLDDELELKDKELQEQIAESYKAYLRGDFTDARELLRQLRKEMRAFKKVK